MKARVYVPLKPSVLDPQGQTIRSALNGLGHREILSVRQGKYFEIEHRRSNSRDKRRQGSRGDRARRALQSGDRGLSG